MIPRQAGGFRAEMVDGQILLYRPAKSTLVCGNETGTIIWQLCDGQRSVDEIVAILSAAYPESSDSIREEVRSVLDVLAQHGAIEWKA